MWDCQFIGNILYGLAPPDLGVVISRRGYLNNHMSKNHHFRGMPDFRTHPFWPIDPLGLMEKGPPGWDENKENQWQRRVSRCFKGVFHRSVKGSVDWLDGILNAKIGFNPYPMICGKLQQPCLAVSCKGESSRNGLFWTEIGRTKTATFLKLWCRLGSRSVLSERPGRRWRNLTRCATSTGLFADRGWQAGSVLMLGGAKPNRIISCCLFKLISACFNWMIWVDWYLFRKVEKTNHYFDYVCTRQTLVLPCFNLVSYCKCREGSSIYCGTPPHGKLARFQPRWSSISDLKKMVEGNM